MEMNDFKTVMQKLASECNNKDMQGICILTQSDDEGKGISVMVCGDPTEITIAIMRAMASDSKVKAIIKIAAENYNIVKRSSDNSNNETLFEDFNLN